MSISDGSLLGVHAAPECDMSIVAYHMALFVGRAGHVLTPELRSELRPRASGPPATAHRRAPRRPLNALPLRGADRRPSRVRPYALTGGRTRFAHVLLVETFVATIESPEEVAGLPPGAGGRRWRRRYGRSSNCAAACGRWPRSRRGCGCRSAWYAYCSATWPTREGFASTGPAKGPVQPDRALLERVLSGLRRL